MNSDWNIEERISLEIMKHLDNGMYFEKIYHKYITRFHVWRKFLRYFENNILYRYGVDRFRNYLMDYYIENYNNELLWGTPSFRLFWKEKGIEVSNLRDMINFYNLIKDIHNEITNKLLHLPENYLKNIQSRIDNNRQLDSSEYKYISLQKNWTYDTFIEKYFMTYLTKSQMDYYCESLLEKYMRQTKKFDFYKFLKYCFGYNYKKTYLKEHDSLFWRVFRYHTLMYRINFVPYKNVVEIIDRMGVSQEEKDKILKLRDVVTSVDDGEFNIIQVKSNWENYTEQDVINRLDEALIFFRQRRQPFSKIRILGALYGLPQELSEKFSHAVFNESKHKALINKHIKEKKVELLNNYISTNEECMKFDMDKWKVYYWDRQTITSNEYNFEKLPKAINYDVKRYIKHIFRAKESIVNKCGAVILIFNDLVNQFGIKSITELSEDILYEYLHVTKSSEKKSSNTLRQKLYQLKEFYTVMSSPQFHGENLKNPASNVYLRNVHKNTQHTKPIPPEVRIAIERHLDEVDKMTRIMYLIFAETGLRFGEQVECEVGAIELDSQYPELARIYYYQQKTKKQQIKKGVNEKRFVHISRNLYNEILNYIEKTKDIREKYKEDLIYISEKNGGIRCKVSTTKSRRQINDIIKKYNITTSDGELWTWTNRQMRKSVAVDLISNDKSTVYHVQNLLDHLSPSTTELYYAEVDNIKVMRKNTEFFKKKFSIYTDKNNLIKFTEEERRILYIDFLRNYREVEFGYCCKHQSEGTCESLGENLCADCPKMVTGIKFLYKWERLYKESRSRVDAFIKTYNNAGISEEEYSDYIEFKKENNMMQKYKSVIDAINQLG